MRPLRIEVEGFSAHRAMTEPIDFDGVDFFSLSGPTGSGKSSLIDAMVFALFGRVPRLGGNAVAPAITAGADRARVRFDFEVAGVEYTAVRMAQRTPGGGASVKEARLEQDGTVLADGAADVTSEVEELLRLSFDDFTRTVVLPQGDFARFLTAPPRERQELLRSLLGLDVYVTVRDLARTRSAVAAERAEGARRTLGGLDLADADAREAALARVQALEGLSHVLPEKEKALAELEHSLERSREEVSRLTDASERLDSIAVPDRLDELESLQVGARSRVADAETALEAATSDLEEFEEKARDLPSTDQLTVWSKGRERLDVLDQKLAANEAEIVDAAEKRAAAESELDRATETLHRARAALESARGDHSAHTLASALEVGETCPVCTNRIVELPELEDPPGLSKLEAAVADGETRLDEVRAATEAARTTEALLGTTRESLDEERARGLAELEEAPPMEEIETLRAQSEEVRSRLVTIRTAVKDGETVLKQAQRDLEDLADASRQVDKRLTTAQLTVADLDPPVSEADDVTVRWKDLIAWRDQTVTRLAEDLEAVSSEVSEGESAVVRGRRELVDVLQGQGIPVVDPFAVQVATALQTARSTVESQERAVEEADRLRGVADSAESEAAVATALVNHLKSNGFEQWLMAGALAELVSGANDLLDQLSDGGYSLETDDSGSFAIVDHRNADERRSVATLSGGETFLVSLALALSLAETLAAKGGAGLDAIILDEGFGTLDDESLDIVASVLEELTGKGLMVGVITHVKELAARAPVRYEVTREPGGARVRLVS